MLCKPWPVTTTVAEDLPLNDLLFKQEKTKSPIRFNFHLPTRMSGCCPDGTIQYRSFCVTPQFIVCPWDNTVQAPWKILNTSQTHHAIAITCRDCSPFIGTLTGTGWQWNRLNVVVKMRVSCSSVERKSKGTTSWPSGCSLQSPTG